MKFRPDWEQALAPVLSHLRGRAEVDPDRIALMGVSFGGYLAPRAASGAPGVAALIVDPGQFGLIEEMRSRLPPFLGRQIPDGNPLALWALDRLMARRMKHPTAGWALRRSLFVHGLDRPRDYVSAAAAYTLAGRTQAIRCPTLVCSAENDEIGASANKLYDALTCRKTFQRFAAAEGAGAHCESGARTLFNQRAFDWLDEVLAEPVSRAPRPEPIAAPA